METLSNVRKRKPNSEPMCCPICGVTLRSSEMAGHFAMEMDKLQKIGGNGRPTRRMSLSPIASSSKATGSAVIPEHSLPGSSSQSETGDAKVANEDCWGTYQKIKNNRQNRLKVSEFTTTWGGDFLRVYSFFLLLRLNRRSENLTKELRVLCAIRKRLRIFRFTWKNA